MLAYGVRAGLGLMTKALTLARKRRWGDLVSWRLLSEKVLIYRYVGVPGLIADPHQSCVSTLWNSQLRTAVWMIILGDDLHSCL